MVEERFSLRTRDVAELGRGTRAEACRLRELDVWDNRIGDSGAIALSLAFDTLDARGGLTELHHPCNAVGTAGEEAISHCVHQLN